MAGRAVDGNANQDINQGSCAHPESTGPPAWWSVDLSASNPSQTYVIRNVTIYFRRAHPGNMYLSNENTYILMVLSTIK